MTSKCGTRAAAECVADVLLIFFSCICTPIDHGQRPITAGVAFTCNKSFFVFERFTISVQNAAQISFLSWQAQTIIKALPWKERKRPILLTISLFEFPS